MTSAEIDYGVPHTQPQKAQHLRRLGYKIPEIAWALGVAYSTIAHSYLLRKRFKNRWQGGTPCTLCTSPVQSEGRVV